MTLPTADRFAVALFHGEPTYRIDGTDRPSSPLATFGLPSGQDYAVPPDLLPHLGRGLDLSLSW
ncbi:hypothetical protein [Streptomyces sp. NPDC018947]|uniref:hypothetical protein n=1 Tax=Streptomyces sp. NPDC018947 TaxID=3365054 RepID=UPI0037B23238